MTDTDINLYLGNNFFIQDKADGVSLLNANQSKISNVKQGTLDSDVVILKQLTDEITRATNAEMSLASKMDKCNTDIEKLEQSLNSKFLDLSQNITGMTQDVNKNSKDITILETKIEKNITDIKLLDSKIEKNITDIKLLDLNVEKNITDIKLLDSNVEKNTSDIKTLTDQLTELIQYFFKSQKVPKGKN